MVEAAALGHQQLMEELRTHRSSIVPHKESERGPRTAPPPSDCERTDCYWHQHYGDGCKAVLIVIDGYKCLTYRQMIGEVMDYA